MSMLRRTMVTSFALLASLTTNAALADGAAEVRATENGDYSYRFSDEDLLGDTLNNVGDMFRGRPRFARVLLLRPRTSLVSELLKSAEQL